MPKPDTFFHLNNSGAERAIQAAVRDAAEGMTLPVMSNGSSFVSSASCLRGMCNIFLSTCCWKSAHAILTVHQVRSACRSAQGLTTPVRMHTDHASKRSLRRLCTIASRALVPTLTPTCQEEVRTLPEQLAYVHI